MQPPQVLGTRPSSERGPVAAGPRRTSGRHRLAAVAGGVGLVAASLLLPAASAAASQGTVKWFNAEKGYGFIARDSSEPLATFLAPIQDRIEAGRCTVQDLFAPDYIALPTEFDIEEGATYQRVTQIVCPLGILDAVFSEPS